VARKPRPWYRTATGYWFVTIKGQQLRLPVSDPQDEAGAWAAFQQLVQAAVATGAPPGQTYRQGPVSLLVPEYLDAISHRIREKTRKDYAGHLRRFLARFGDQCIGQLDPSTLEKDAATEGWSDSHRANYLWAVQAFVRWAGRKDFAMRRPAKESRGADAMIPPEVQARILRETTGDFHQLCRLLWCMGCRPMEGASLTVESIDWANATATLRRHKSKHKGKRRVLYFHKEALSILQEQREKYGAGPLFRGQRGEALTLRALVDRFKRLSVRVGCRVRSYDFRHSYITRSLVRGVPAAVVAALVGTSTTMIDKYYSHVTAQGQELREVAERLAG
jgi:integrase